MSNPVNCVSLLPGSHARRRSWRSSRTSRTCSLSIPRIGWTDGIEEDITHLGDTQVFLKIRRELAGLSTPVLAYLVAVVVAAVGLAVGLILLGEGLGGNVAAVLGLAFASAYAERGSITLRGHLTVSISLLPAIFAAVLFGPLAAMIVFGASGLSIAFPWAGRIAYAGSRSIIGALAAGAVALRFECS